MSKFSFLNRNVVDKAIQRIRRNGIPPGRQSTRYNLVTQTGEAFPPKLIIHEAANLQGVDYESLGLAGGDQANGLLENLGYTIVSRNTDEPQWSVTPRYATPTR